MTSIVFAYLHRSNIPTRESWQKAINELSFDLHLELSKDIDPLLDGSICTCVLNRNTTEVANFELYNGPVEFAEEEDKNKYIELAGDRDFHFMFKSYGTIGSSMCICIFCCALLRNFNAVVSHDGFNTNDGKAIEQATVILLAEYNAA